MAIKYTIKGNRQTEEYKDAVALKEIFNRDLPPNVEGDILIISNVTLFGQEIKDIDLIVLGNLKNFKPNINTKTNVSEQANRFFDRNILDGLTELKNQEILVKNFCFVIETKHHRAEDILLDGLTLCVKYNNKLSDVTTQSEKQKYSLKKYFQDRLKFSPYICNFIWLRNVSSQSVKDLVRIEHDKYTGHNYLPSDLNLRWLFQLACLQKAPFLPYDERTQTVLRRGIFNSFNSFKEEFDINEMQTIFELFEKVKAATGDLTRKKIEHITRNILNTQQYAEAIGKKLVVINGRAGTGKTIKLITIAVNLALNNNEKCLILTYNHSLVSDIKRTLALAEIPEQNDSCSIKISTIHKFVYELLFGFGIVEGKYIEGFLNNYSKYLEDLISYIDSGLINVDDIQQLMTNRQDEVAWDYVLIDEAQDWDNNERDLIYKIFTHKRVIITDGIDQLVRKNIHCDWMAGLSRQDGYHKKKPEQKSFRQKINLVKFINAFADELGLSWSIDYKEELIGGKIIITTKPYFKELHVQQFLLCEENGNTPYEMMFLVPPSMVEKANSNLNTINFNSHFKYISSFNDELGIKIWDGTNPDLRSQYVVNLDEHRLLQYDSCRGLEGWIVVCLNFDDFLKYKKQTYKDIINENELALTSFDERLNKHVNLWALIPLTRAIDTLIITIKDKESEYAKKLKNVYHKFPDFIDWIE